LLVYTHIVTEALNIYNINKIIVDYRRKRVRHLLRLNDIPIPKLVCKYVPNGTRNLLLSTHGINFDSGSSDTR
jgi:hypothetical protein